MHGTINIKQVHVLPKHPHITKPTHTHTHITKPTHTHTHTLQNSHIHTPTHHKTHTYTHPHIHTHTNTLQNPHIHTPTHYKTHTYTHLHIRTSTQCTHPHINIHTHSGIDPFIAMSPSVTNNRLWTESRRSLPLEWIIPLQRSVSRHFERVQYILVYNPSVSVVQFIMRCGLQCQLTD